MSAATLADLLRASRGFGHKTDIAGLLARLQQALPAGAQAEARGILLGDDCAAIADGDSHLLFAIEGMVGDFLRAMRMVRRLQRGDGQRERHLRHGRAPLAVVDAIWSEGWSRPTKSCAAWPLPRPLTACRWWAATATRAATAPSCSGHPRARARRLLTSFGARPGQRLLMAVDLRGRFEEPYPYWNATTGVPGARLRADLELLPALAEDGLCAAAKDISMAGAVGTALMLMECSGVGGTIDLDALPIPPGVPLPRWLSAFPATASCSPSTRPTPPRWRPASTRAPCLRGDRHARRIAPRDNRPGRRAGLAMGLRLRALHPAPAAAPACHPPASMPCLWEPEPCPSRTSASAGPTSAKRCAIRPLPS